MKLSRRFTWSASFGVLVLAIAAIALAIPSAKDILFPDISAGSEPSQEGSLKTTSVSVSTVGSYENIANQSILNQTDQGSFASRIIDQLPTSTMGKAADGLSDSGAHSSIAVAIAEAATEVRPHRDLPVNFDAEATQFQPMFLVVLGLGLTGLALWAWGRHNRGKQRLLAVRRT